MQVTKNVLENCLLRKTLEDLFREQERGKDFWGSSLRLFIFFLCCCCFHARKWAKLLQFRGLQWEVTGLQWAPVSLDTSGLFFVFLVSICIQDTWQWTSEFSPLLLLEMTRSVAIRFYEEAKIFFVNVCFSGDCQNPKQYPRASFWIGGKSGPQYLLCLGSSSLSKTTLGKEVLRDQDTWSSPTSQTFQWDVGMVWQEDTALS